MAPKALTHSPTILPSQARDGRPTSKTTFQMLAAIPAPQDSARRRFQTTIVATVRWMAKRFNERLPPQAFEGATVDLNEGIRRFESASLPDGGIWAARMTHADEPFGQISAVPGRSWMVEVALRRGDDRIKFGMRVSCISSSYSQLPIALTIPGLIGKLASSVGLNDVRPLARTPWTIRSETELLELRQLISNKFRSLPVVLLTQPDPRAHRVHLRDFMLDGDDLSARLFCAAHVVQMPRDINFKWTDLVGRQWSCFLGAVRTYYPGIALEESSPWDHPYIKAERILFWQHEDLKCEAAFSQHLVEKLILNNASRRVDFGETVFFADALAVRTLAWRGAVEEAEDWRAIYDSELKAKDELISLLQKERNEAFELADESERIAKVLEGENDKLRYQIDALRYQLSEKTGTNPDITISFPENYKDVADWVDQYLTGRVFLHPRARGSLKDAVYFDLSLVCKALLLLANEYRDSRLGIDPTKSKIALDAKLDELRLRFGGSITRARAGQHDDTYFVAYPTSSGKRWFLDSHLRCLSNSRQPERCLAIYFFWHDETRQVVIGWLPSHLENRLT